MAYLKNRQPTQGFYDHSASMSKIHHQGTGTSAAFLPSSSFTSLGSDPIWQPVWWILLSLPFAQSMVEKFIFKKGSHKIHKNLLETSKKDGPLKSSKIHLPQKCLRAYLDRGLKPHPLKHVSPVHQKKADRKNPSRIWG